MISLKQWYSTFKIDPDRCPEFSSAPARIALWTQSVSVTKTDGRNRSYRFAGFRAKCRTFLSDFNQNWNVATNFSKNSKFGETCLEWNLDKIEFRVYREVFSVLRACNLTSSICITGNLPEKEKSGLLRFRYWQVSRYNISRKSASWESLIHTDKQT
jgi:hypothetical protein